jgi:hypothetical protein
VSPSVNGPVDLTTALGTLGFDLVDESGELSAVEHMIDVFPFVPPDRDPMSVERATAVLLTLTPRRRTRGLRFRCRWVTPPPQSSYDDQDQFFVSWVWEGENRLVQVGTEDGDAIYGRSLPFRSMLLRGASSKKSFRWWPEASHGGIEIPIPRPPPQAATVRHFIVAENPSPEPSELAAFFAATSWLSDVLDQQPTPTETEARPDD